MSDEEIEYIQVSFSDCVFSVYTAFILIWNFEGPVEIW